MRPKTKPFAVKFRRILKVLRCKVYRKSSGRNFTIYASKNEAVRHEVQTNFGRCPPARFTEKVLGAISRFMRPKMKLFAMKFRRILDVLRLRGLQKICGRMFTMCVAQTNILDFNIL